MLFRSPITFLLVGFGFLALASADGLRNGCSICVSKGCFGPYPPTGLCKKLQCKPSKCFPQQCDKCINSGCYNEFIPENKYAKCKQFGCDGAKDTCKKRACRSCKKLGCLNGKGNKAACTKAACYRLDWCPVNYCWGSRNRDCVANTCKRCARKGCFSGKEKTYFCKSRGCKYLPCGPSVEPPTTPPVVPPTTPPTVETPCEKLEKCLAYWQMNKDKLPISYCDYLKKPCKRPGSV